MNLREVEELKGMDWIVRASMLLARGLGPVGTMRRVYGACPPEPEMESERSSHWVGELSKAHE